MENNESTENQQDNNFNGDEDYVDSSLIGSKAGLNHTRQEKVICIGDYAMSEHSRSIVIGDNLTATQELQLLVSFNGVRINRIMTDEEFDYLFVLINCTARKVSEIFNRR